MQKATVTEQSDEELMKLIKQDNLLAFNMLFERYWESLYRFCYAAYYDAPLAEDAIQEVYTTLWERRKRLEIKNVKGWLYQAVKYQVAANFKKVKFTSLHDQVIDQIAFSLDVEERMNYLDVSYQLTETLKSLPPRCREIFQMSRFKNMSNDEIAQELSITKRTVENQISRALKHISNSMDIAMTVAVLSLCYPAMSLC